MDMKQLIDSLKAKYHPTVRIGNWNEEMYDKEEKIREFLEKRERGDLLVQKTRALFSNLLRPIEIDPPCQHIRFGAVVQLQACDMPSFNQHSTVPLALSVVVSEKTIHQSQNISERSDVTVAPAQNTCFRNTFRITSVDDVDRTNEPLLYGQDFHLQCIDGEGTPLVLYSSPKTMGLMNTTPSSNIFFNDHGEENQSVGVCSRDDASGRNDCRPSIPASHCRWKALYIVRSKRFEMEDEPVPPNVRLVVNNSHSNRNLAAEEKWFPTFFGPELGVTATSYIDPHRCEKRQNIWKFVTQQNE